MTDNTMALIALGASLGYRVEGSMAETSDNRPQGRYATPKGAHEQSEALIKAEAKRQRKAAKRINNGRNNV